MYPLQHMYSTCQAAHVTHMSSCTCDAHVKLRTAHACLPLCFQAPGGLMWLAVSRTSWLGVSCALTPTCVGRMLPPAVHCAVLSPCWRCDDGGSVFSASSVCRVHGTSWMQHA